MRFLGVFPGGRRRDPGPVGAALVAQVVEHLVAGLAVVLERPQVRVLHRPGDVADEALDEGGVAVEHDLDDALTVDAHRERLLHLRVEELPVLRLARVRVPGDVRGLGSGNLVDDEAVVVLQDLHGVERDLVDPVEVALTQLGDHRVRVGEVRERDGLGVGRLPVVPLPRDEDRRALLLVLLDRVGACRDDGQVLLRMERLQVLPVGAHQRLPDVLRDDEQLLQLGEHVPDRGVVVDHERVLVRRLRARHMPERGRRHRGRPGRELDDGVDGPGGVVGRERRLVRPRTAWLEGERPVLAVRLRSPRTPPSRPR